MMSITRQVLRMWRRPIAPLMLARHYSVNSVNEHYVNRRAMLYVPGNDEKKIRKLTGLDVDCACLDCEDGVALNRKQEARQTICLMLDEVDFGGTEAAVRINSISSGLAEEDLRVVLKAEKIPPTLMLPKVEVSSDMEWFSDALKECLNGRQNDPDFDKLNLIIFVESAVGMLNLQSVCQRASDLSEAPGAVFNLDGIVFGSDDFCADIGATRTADAKELMYARQKVVLIAKAFRVQAIDMVHIAYKDTDALKTQAEEGARMGFTGKQVIHPIQVPIVQQAFTPSAEKVEWARELIQAFIKHHESGKGAFTFKGSMIDMPLLLQAKNIIHLSQTMTKSKDTNT